MLWALIDADMPNTGKTFCGDNVNLALAAAEVGPRKLYTNTGSDYLTDANLFALI